MPRRTNSSRSAGQILGRGRGWESWSRLGFVVVTGWYLSVAGDSSRLGTIDRRTSQGLGFVVVTGWYLSVAGDSSRLGTIDRRTSQGLVVVD
jgi:hypothetical protein